MAVRRRDTKTKCRRLLKMDVTRDPNWLAQSKDKDTVATDNICTRRNSCVFEEDIYKKVDQQQKDWVSVM